ncbi:MAG: hypothetical protein FWJ66_07255 [Caldibacillus sp.]
MTFMTYEERAFRETLAWRMNIRKKKEYAGAAFQIDTAEDE